MPNEEGEQRDRSASPLTKIPKCIATGRTSEEMPTNFLDLPIQSGGSLPSICDGQFNPKYILHAASSMLSPPHALPLPRMPLLTSPQCGPTPGCSPTRTKPMQHAPSACPATRARNPHDQRLNTMSSPANSGGSCLLIQ